MKKRLKRLLSLGMSLAMAVSALPMTAFADTPPTEAPDAGQTKYVVTSNGSTALNKAGESISQAAAGEKITFIPEPQEGRVFYCWDNSYIEASKIPAEDFTAQRYLHSLTMTMPDHNVALNARYSDAIPVPEVGLKLNPPAAGEKLDRTVETDDPLNYTATVTWSYKDTFGKTVLLPEKDVLAEKDKTYTAFILVYPKNAESYPKEPDANVLPYMQVFDETAPVLLNGEAPKSVKALLANNPNTANYASQVGVLNVLSKPYDLSGLSIGVKYLLISKAPEKTVYLEGESFDPTGMSVAAKFGENSTEVLDKDRYLIRNGDSLKAGQKSVTIEFRGKTVEQPITVYPVSERTGIAASAQPAKTEYFVGDAFDPAGMELKEVYESGYTKPIPSSEWEVLTKELQENQTSVQVKWNNEVFEVPIEITVKPIVLSDLSIKLAPAWAENKYAYAYYIGEDFDRSRIIVDAVYSDGTKEENVQDYTVENGQSLKEGQESVLIQYKGFEKAEQIIVIPKITGLNIKTPPDKVVYTEGEDFDPTGLTVTLRHNGKDGEYPGIIQHQYLYYNGQPELKNLTTDMKEIVITLNPNFDTTDVPEGTQAVLPIMVNPKPVVLESITITQSPDKIFYHEGDAFDPAGMKVVANYSNGTSKPVTDWTVVNGESLKLDQDSVTIEYEGKTAEQLISVSERPVVPESLKIIKAPDKTEYIEGEDFDPTGMELAVVYNNGTEKAIVDYGITGGTAMAAGTEFVTVSYETLDIRVPITVSAKPAALKSIDITKAPDKTDYTEGEAFDPTGMEVTASYEDGTTAVVEGWTVTNGDPLKAYQRSVTIEYNGKTTTQRISVAPFITRFTGIEVLKAPYKTEYIAGENFDSRGMVIGACYNDPAKNHPLEKGWTVENGKNLKEGQSSVTIEYNGKTTELPITVSANPYVLDKIEITKAPDKVVYNAGNNFNAKGMEVTAVYTNGEKKVVEGWTVTDGKKLKEGQTTITVEYEGKTATQDITVNPKPTIIQTIQRTLQKISDFFKNLFPHRG